MNTVVLKKKTVYAAAGLCLLAAVCIFFALRCRIVNIYPQTRELKANGQMHKLQNEVFIYNKNTYISAGEVLPLFGFAIDWDNDTETLYAKKNSKVCSISAESNILNRQGKAFSFNQPAKMHEDHIYLNVAMFKKITGKTFRIKETVQKNISDTAFFYADKNEFVLNGITKKIDDVPVKINGEILLSAASVLERCGYSISEENGLLTAERFGVKSEISAEQIISGGKKTEYAAVFYHNRLFVSADAFEFITGIDTEIDGDIRESSFNKRDCLENTQQSDKYRKTEYFGTYNGVTIADGIGMELLGISEKSAEKYAEMINKTADALENTNVYSIIIPSAGEFYSPESMKVSQIKGIRAAYKALNKKVTPINAYAALCEKADEHIFFKTDHHWTQRGAYYAYREFANQKGMYIPPLDEFETEKIYGYLGSFAAFAAGTPGETILSANTDEFEKFYPSVNAKCTFYSDGEMKNKTGTGEVVSAYHSYTSFIGGDHPVTKIETDVKNGKTLVIIKESYGNAFTTWSVNNYETIYAIDPREFNGFGGKDTRFDLKKFYEQTQFDDLIIITYPVSTISEEIRNSILKMTD